MLNENNQLVLANFMEFMKRNGAIQYLQFFLTLGKLCPSLNDYRWLKSGPCVGLGLYAFCQRSPSMNVVNERHLAPFGLIIDWSRFLSLNGMNEWRSWWVAHYILPELSLQLLHKTSEYPGRVKSALGIYSPSTMSAPAQIWSFTKTSTVVARSLIVIFIIHTQFRLFLQMTLRRIYYLVISVSLAAAHYTNKQQTYIECSVSQALPTKWSLMNLWWSSSKNVSEPCIGGSTSIWIP